MSFLLTCLAYGFAIATVSLVACMAAVSLFHRSDLDEEAEETEADREAKYGPLK